MFVSLVALRTAREIVQYADDVRWAVRVGSGWVQSLYESPVVGREIELIEKFRACRPMEHDEPVWHRECEFDHEEWHLIFPLLSKLPCEPP